MHTGVPTVVSRNICISQHCVFSAYTNEMKLVLYIIHITVDALSIFAWTPEYLPVSISKGCDDNLSLAIAFLYFLFKRL